MLEFALSLPIHGKASNKDFNDLFLQAISLFNTRLEVMYMPNQSIISIA